MNERTIILPAYGDHPPRSGRKEHEPHSMAVNRLHDVLAANFPGDRVMRDLHHHFTVLEDGGIRTRYDLIFDIAFYQDLAIPDLLEEFISSEHGHRVPTMAINSPTMRTWDVDMAGYVEACKMLGIPLYIVFEAFHVVKQLPAPPFLRAYYFDENGDHVHVDLRRVFIKEGGLRESRLLEDNVLSFPGVVPFQIGLMELREGVRCDNGEIRPTYQLVLITSSGNVL